MTRRQIAGIVAFVIACSGLSALVAYRRGLRRIASPFASASSTGAHGPCIDFKDAKAHLGEMACVSGRVGRVFTSRNGNTFLDFCADYRTCPFASVIFSSDRKKFGNLEMLRGRQVEIDGAINFYQDRAEIIIHDPQQVRVLP